MIENKGRYSEQLAKTTYKLQLFKSGGRLQDAPQFWKEAIKIEEELTTQHGFWQKHAWWIRKIRRKRLFCLKYLEMFYLIFIQQSIYSISPRASDIPILFLNLSSILTMKIDFSSKTV